MSSNMQKEIIADSYDNSGHERSNNFSLDMANLMREKLAEVEDLARSMDRVLCNKCSWSNWEVIAHARLALRHIEDARMRYGKVIQYSTDWVSVYDKKDAPTEQTAETSDTASE